MTFEGFAPAKINLALHVTGQRPDGYHLLDSLVVFADIEDRLWFDPAQHLTLEVAGPFAQGVPQDSGNLIWQAAELAGFTGHIRLEKYLPHGAGIGGGSSDAAAVLRHMGFIGDAAGLGADVPVCLRASAQRMQGIGDVLTPLEAFPQVHAVLVNPAVKMATPPVFKALKHKENPALPGETPHFVDAAALIEWLHGTRNDLQAPALMVAPQIATVLAALGGQPETRFCRMSGSGSTCFGLFETADDAATAAARLGAQHPEWWVQTCVLS
ncbi:MAG: 4-diphosphocytidyl-2-C-methyl-D-erythritol kinase [Sulfitobacter sp.]|jgi:4-diphosphocytidyl-2-C-methyl-D-erythritol kinase